MSHPAGYRRGRLALPLVASLALGFAALPALGGVQAARAASAHVAHTAEATGPVAKHVPVPDPPRANHALITPFLLGPTTITDCTTANLIAAIPTSSSITFNCHTPANTNAPVGGRYVLALTAITGPFDSGVNPSLTIDGSDGGSNDITLDGANVTRILTVKPSTSVTLKNLELAHGNASDGTVTGTFATNGYGGAVEALGQLTATNVVFYQNQALHAGGALELDVDTTLAAGATTADSITQSTFDGNIANGDEGGAIAIDVNGVKGSPQTVGITGSLFISNSATTNSGGAIEVDNGKLSNVTIAGSAFEYNTANNDGGAIDVDSADNVTVNASTFVGNTATDDGGAIDSNSGVVNVNNSTFTRNSITDVITNADGAALTSEGGILNVAFSTINSNGGPLNTGPAITNDNGTLGSVTVRNSILSNNTVGSTIANCGARTGQVSVTDLDLGYNLEGPAGANTCLFSVAKHDLLGVDPLLGPLGSYGGPTVGATGFALGASLAAQPTYTERLLPGSPAIDQIPVGSCVDTSGAPLTTDQRGAGFVRPFPAGGNCDIGAFEAFEASILTTGNCSAAITFFSGGTAFALRTGSSPNTLMSYLSIKGPGGTITAVPLVPRAGVPNTLTCTTPDLAAPATVPPASATTVTVDAQVVASTNPSVARLSAVRMVATRTLTGETVTVSAINPVDNTTGATLYTLTPSVQPQSFVVRVGTFTLYPFF